MKRIFFYLIATFFLTTSCKDDEVDPQQRDLGFLESFFTNNPEIVIQKTTESDVIYKGGRATHRGYVFKPLIDMKIMEIGARIAKTGTYTFEIYDLEKGLFSKEDTIIIDSIKINNTEGFQYKEITNNVTLDAEKEYLIRYFNEDHTSVYDGGLGYSSESDSINVMHFPLTIKDIEIQLPYYTYMIKDNGEYFLISEGTYDLGIFRGLIDFKYRKVD